MLELDLNALPFKHWLCDSNVISILPAAYTPGAAVCASLSRRLKCSCPAGVSAVYYNFFHSLRLFSEKCDSYLRSFYIGCYFIDH
jgi:hypothetical protein